MRDSTIAQLYFVQQLIGYRQSRLCATQKRSRVHLVLHTYNRRYSRRRDALAKEKKRNKTKEDEDVKEKEGKEEKKGRVRKKKKEKKREKKKRGKKKKKEERSHERCQSCQ